MNWDKITSWSANIVTLVGVTLTSYDVYPTNLMFMVVASLLWIATGVLWRKPELWSLNSVILLIYLNGLFK